MDERDGEQQRERNEELARDRKARGEIRDAHLEGGRTQAREDVAQTQPEANFEERKAAAEELLKAEVRGSYSGTDEEFERDWPAIREQMITEYIQKQADDSRRGGL